MNKIKGFKIRLRKREILRILRYSSDYTEIDPEIEGLIQKNIEKAYELIYPCVVYRTFSNMDNEYDQVREQITCGSAQVKKLLGEAVAFSMMAVTIGDILESESNRIKEKDLTGSFILDAAGSEAVEQAANFTSKILKEEADSQECYLSSRFSPGYGDWQLAASRELFKFLDIGRIGIDITPENILTPRKSITAVQAWMQQ